jgi:hypothetical protein
MKLLTEYEHALTFELLDASTLKEMLGKNF